LTSPKSKDYRRGLRIMIVQNN